MSSGVKTAACLLVLSLGIVAQNAPTQSSSGTSQGSAATDSTKAYKATVIVLATVSEDGKVLGASVLHPSNHDLDRAAVETVKKWKFKPAMKDGKPVKVMLKIEVNFDLRPPASPPSPNPAPH